VLIRRILLAGPAAVRRLACGLGPAPSFGGPLRDEGVVGSGEPAQGGGLAGERLIVPAGRFILTWFTVSGSNARAVISSRLGNYHGNRAVGCRG